MERQMPSNKNATKEAIRLLDYLCECVKQQKIITGQHTQTFDPPEIAYIKEQTGYEPKLRGFEMLAYSPNINYEDAGEECLKEVWEDKGTLADALSWGSDKEHIVTLSFHWFSPMYGRDKSFYAEHTEFDPERVLTEGSPEREAFYSDMDVIAEELEKFQAASIAVLWRPFHESDGRWFWWGSKGPKCACELYKLMYDYYVDVKHLDNLLWVWNCAAPEGYPGDEYVDVISRDIYMPEYKPTSYREEYEELIANTTQNKVAALAEVGILPDAGKLQMDHTPWAYFMAWSKEWIIGDEHNRADRVKQLYASGLSIKL